MKKASFIGTLNAGTAGGDEASDKALIVLLDKPDGQMLYFVKGSLIDLIQKQSKASIDQLGLGQATKPLKFSQVATPELINQVRPWPRDTRLYIGEPRNVDVDDLVVFTPKETLDVLEAVQAVQTARPTTLFLAQLEGVRNVVQSQESKEFPRANLVTTNAHPKLVQQLPHIDGGLLVSPPPDSKSQYIWLPFVDISLETAADFPRSRHRFPIFHNNQFRDDDRFPAFLQDVRIEIEVDDTNRPKKYWWKKLAPRRRPAPRLAQSAADAELFYGQALVSNPQGVLDETETVDVRAIHPYDLFGDAFIFLAKDSDLVVQTLKRFPIQVTWQTTSSF